MNKALSSTIMDHHDPEVNRPNKKISKDNAANDIAIIPGTCPRSVDEVFSLAVKLQYFVGDIYLEIAESRTGSDKKFYREMAMKQLDIKNEIQKMANDNLNQLLGYFYDNGGPIIEPPVSELSAKEIQPFYNRIAANTIQEINSFVDTQEIDSREATETISNKIVEMYSAMSRLYTETAVKDAFNELIELHTN